MGVITEEPERSEEPSEVQTRPGAAFDRIVGNLANSAVAAWIGATTGLPDAATTLGGVVGPLAEELSYAVRKIATVQQAQAQYVITEAANHSDVPVDRLIDDLTRDPVRLQLLLRSLEAAGRAASDTKLRLLAHLLATGALAQDDTIVSEQTLAVETVAELDTPHFRMLTILALSSPVWWDTERDRDRYRDGWPERRIVERSPGLKNALRVLAARLEALGLVERLPFDSNQEPIWRLTGFGKLCVMALKNLDSDHDRVVPGSRDEFEADYD